MSSDDDEDMDYCPGTSEAVIQATTTHVVPAYSKHKYNRAYEDFKKWNNSNGETPVTQNVLLKYFLKMAEKNKPTTLWAYYSMLKATLRENDNIDITSWSKLLDFLKRNNRGYKPVKATCFGDNELEKFMNEAPDEQWLDVKVVCIFGLNGAYSTHKLVNIQIDHVKEYENYYWVLMPNAEINQSFTITGSLFHIVKRYVSLRPQKTFTNRFFLQYIGGKCNTIPMGRNGFYKISRRIAKYLDLPKPELYGASSFRLSTANELLLRLSVRLLNPSVAESDNASLWNNASASDSISIAEPFIDIDDQSVEYSLDYETGLMKTSVTHKVSTASVQSKSNDYTAEHICTNNCGQVKCVKEDNEKNVFHAFSIMKPSDYAITEVIPAHCATNPTCRWMVAYSHFIDPVSAHNSEEKFDEITKQIPKNVIVLQKYIRCNSSKLFAAYVVVYGVKCRCQIPIYEQTVVKPAEVFRKRNLNPIWEQENAITSKFRKRNIDAHFDPNFDPLSALEANDLCFSVGDIKQEQL